MAEKLTTKFLDSDGSGKITLYANKLSNGRNFYGKFERNTINTNTLIARIQKRKAGTNELSLQQTAGFLKEEILEALSRGESVNVLDLGTMYPSIQGRYNGKTFDPGEKQLFTAKFTPSQIANSALSKVSIKEISVADTSPLITSVINLLTGKADGILSKGKSVHLDGERLKIDGEKGGVFLCPLNENKEPVQDESTWIPCPIITRNAGKNLEFFLPDELESGAEFRILVRTYYLKKDELTKTAREGLSETVTIA